VSRPGFEIIRGAHIDLVEVDPVHFEQIVRWRSDPEIGPQFFFSGPYTLKGQRKWYERYRLDEKDLTFVATLKTGFPVGMAALYDIDEEKAVAQFGRLLVGERAYRARGSPWRPASCASIWAFAILVFKRSTWRCLHPIFQLFASMSDWVLSQGSVGST